MVTLGGCCQQSQAAWIDACGVIIRVYNAIVSPDFDGLEGDCTVGLADFIVFSTGYISGASGCTDYTGSGRTELGDFIVFGQSWAHFCLTR